MSLLSLAELRRSVGMTQADVAKRTGWSRSKVSRVERSKDPWISELQRYASALGVELDFIFSHKSGARFTIPLKKLVKSRSRTKISV